MEAETATELITDAHPGLPQLVLSSMPYNITLNLTSILAFLPSRLIKSRILSQFWKRWDNVVEMGMAGESPSVGGLLAETGWPTTSSILEAAAATHETPSPRPQPHMMYPGPWGFFISGYMLGIFLMAVVLHRIQNIIIPSRDLRSGRGLRPGVTIGWQRRFSVFGRIPSAIFPLDLTKTSTRLALHLPTLYYLGKMLTTWIILVLQTSELYPEKTGVAWIDQLGDMVRAKDMQDICWNTFMAVCTAFSVEGFVKALDGVEAGFPIGGNMNPNTSPFNIVGYAFLLHLYSSPFAHTQKNPEGPELPSRPDKHAIITVAIPLLQLTLFHALSVSKRWSSHRLLPTALTSFLSLTHFHGALLSYYYRSGTTAFDSVNGSRVPTPQARLLTTYPILNYVPNIFETLLLLTIFLTITLNVIVQMVVRGRVDRIFSGLGVSHTPNDDDATEESGLRAFFRNLPYDEDFGVLLLRVGTASLEATGLRGWSNEVAPVHAPARRRKKTARRTLPPGSGSGSAQIEYGSVRMGRIAAGGVQSGIRTTGGAVNAIASGSSGSSEPLETAKQRKVKQRTMRGLSNEVRHVDLGVNSTSPNGGGGSALGSGGWWRWVREVVRYLEAIWAALKGLASLFWSWVLFVARGRKNNREKNPRPLRRTRARVWHRFDLDADGDRDGSGEEDETGTEDSAAERYQKFLRGENLSDDDDDEDFKLEEGDEEDEEDEEATSGGEHDEEFEDPEREAFGLFTDLMRIGLGEAGSSNPTHSTSVVLAHMAGANTSPLTRRRWQMTVSTTSPQVSRRISSYGYADVEDEGEDEWVVNSDSNNLDTRDEQGKMTCVICTSENRDIICWPCRCLAMCDGCREALASRSAPSKHRCPCCRQLIEGYSRIYIP